MAALSCVLAVWAQGEALCAQRALSPYWRMGNALISYVVYLGQVFYPAGLAVPYPRRGLDLPLWQVSGAFLVLAGHHGGGAGLEAESSLPVGRLVVVLGNAAACDRAGPVRVSGDGRPLHVLAADRAVPRHRLGDRPRAAPGVASVGMRRRFGAGAGGSDGVCLATNDLLAQSRNTMDPLRGMQLAQLCGA